MDKNVAHSSNSCAAPTDTVLVNISSNDCERPNYEKSSRIKLGSTHVFKDGVRFVEDVKFGIGPSLFMAVLCFKMLWPFKGSSFFVFNFIKLKGLVSGRLQLKQG